MEFLCTPGLLLVENSNAEAKKRGVPGDEDKHVADAMYAVVLLESALSSKDEQLFLDHSCRMFPSDPRFFLQRGYCHSSVLHVHEFDSSDGRMVAADLHQVMELTQHETGNRMYQMATYMLAFMSGEIGMAQNSGAERRKAIKLYETFICSVDPRDPHLPGVHYHLGLLLLDENKGNDLGRQLALYHYNEGLRAEDERLPIFTINQHLKNELKFMAL